MRRWPYLAGIIDGEGTITITREIYHNRKTYQLRPRILVTNTSLKLMEYLKTEFGGNYRVSKSKKSNRKICYVWMVLSVKDLWYVLKNILSYLIIKRDQGLILKDYMRSRGFDITRGTFRPYSEYEKELQIKIRLLNQKNQKNPNYVN